MQRTLKILFFVLQSLVVYSQRENNIWVFGHSAGLDFNSGTAVLIKKQLGTNDGSASVCDANGKLLFYGMGDRVFNANGQAMNNDIPIVTYSTLASSQGALIVPMINSSTKYYYFSLEDAESVTANGCRLSYSVIDMSLQSGLGDVDPANKGVLLDENLTEKMIAIPGGDCNIWLLVHAKGSNEFKAYSITAEGINRTPVLSNAGSLSNAAAYMEGVMKVSPSRRLLAVCSMAKTIGLPGAGGFELMDFDPTTGKVSNARILVDNVNCYGTCFSPDGTKLYVDGDRGGPDGNFVSQFDISLSTLTDIIDSKADVFAYPFSGNLLYSDMRAGPDGKIYIGSTINVDYMDVIADPNIAGAGCNYQPRALKLLPLTTVHFGLPNIYVMPVPKDTTYHVHDMALCATSDSLILEGPDESYFFEWDNGTTESKRSISELGTYWVKSRNYCSVRVDTFKVTEVIDMSFSLGNDTQICGASYVLRAPEVTDASYLWGDGSQGKGLKITKSGTYRLTISKKNCSYTDDIELTVTDLTQELNDVVVCRNESVNVALITNVPEGASVEWSTGSNSSEIVATDTGNYWVRVSMQNCVEIDTVLIYGEFCECNYFFPSSFTPNQDGRNDKFKIVVQNECPIKGYRLDIYNRWGQLIFTTNDPTHGWDGNYKGKSAEIGTYMYITEFTAGTRGLKKQSRGDLVLIR